MIAVSDLSCTGLNIVKQCQLSQSVVPRVFIIYRGEYPTLI